MADVKESSGKHATAGAADTTARWAEEQLFELCKGEEPAELSRYHNLLLVPNCQVGHSRPTHSVAAPVAPPHVCTNLALTSAHEPIPGLQDPPLSIMVPPPPACDRSTLHTHPSAAPRCIAAPYAATTT